MRSTGGELPVHCRSPLPASDRAPDALDVARELEFVARLDDPLEADPVDACEKCELAAILRFGQDCKGARLRHRLDDQNAGHDGPAGKVARQEPLIGPDLFARDNAAAWLDLDDLVEEQEWVAVRQDRLDLFFRQGGHVRDESSGEGVRQDSLHSGGVEPLLRGRFGRPYRFLERCESTQRELPPNAPEGAVVATDEQIAGRGRLGRPWFAAPGTSLLFSINLRPTVPTHRLPELSIVAGHSCAEAIREVTGLMPDIKLPNDLLVGGRKLAGILAEARDDRVVLGIGINVNTAPDELPRDVDHEPTSLLAELGAPVARAPLLAAILLELERRYDLWNA